MGLGCLARFSLIPVPHLNAHRLHGTERLQVRHLHRLPAWVKALHHLLGLPELDELPGGGARLQPMVICGLGRGVRIRARIRVRVRIRARVRVRG